MTAIAPCLWFDGRAEEAARFYVSLLPRSRIGRIMRTPVDLSGGGAGSVLSVEFTLAGRDHVALNGGPEFAFTPAVSMFVTCEDQAEVDRLWDALLEGGSPQQCGWLTDRYGLSWQIVPAALAGMLADPDAERAGRVMQALFGMVKLDLAVLQAAHDGRTA